jgi:hypothetical protein
MSEKHCVAIDCINKIILVNRQAYSWGTGKYGELGIDGSVSNVPMPVNLGKRSFILKAQCGPSYTAFIDCKVVLI